MKEEEKEEEKKKKKGVIQSICTHTHIKDDEAA